MSQSETYPKRSNSIESKSMNQAKKFTATFENGGFWEYYKDLERQFENFLEYVPYLGGNEDTYSFKLLSLILSIGSYIDSAFKEMARFPEFSEDELCRKILRRAKKRRGIITSGVDAFNRIYGISSKVVTFKFIPERDYIKPFDYTEHTPEWWGFYNDLKHDVSINIENANLKNTRNALAAAFLLNAVHIPSALRLLNYGVLKRGVSYEALHGGEVVDPISQVIRFLKEKKRFMGFLSTSIFIYDYNQRME